MVFRSIELPVSQKEKERKLAEYFAEQELQDFRETIELLLQAANNSVVLQGLDDYILEYYNRVLNDVTSKYYNNNVLKADAATMILDTYGQRFDINEFYDDFLKDE